MKTFYPHVFDCELQNFKTHCGHFPSKQQKYYETNDSTCGKRKIKQHIVAASQAATTWIGSCRAKQRRKDTSHEATAESRCMTSPVVQKPLPDPSISASKRFYYHHEHHELSVNYQCKEKVHFCCQRFTIPSPSMNQQINLLLLCFTVKTR